MRNIYLTLTWKQSKILFEFLQGYLILTKKISNKHIEQYTDLEMIAQKIKTEME